MKLSEKQQKISQNFGQKICYGVQVIFAEHFEGGYFYWKYPIHFGLITKIEYVIYTSCHLVWSIYFSI